MGLKWVMIVIFCEECVVLVGTVCVWCVEGVLYWLVLFVGDVWTVWCTGWYCLSVMCGRCGVLVGTVCR
jgi:hypothetical protein